MIPEIGEDVDMTYSKQIAIKYNRKLFTDEYEEENSLSPGEARELAEHRIFSNPDKFMTQVERQWNCIDREVTYGTNFPTSKRLQIDLLCSLTTYMCRNKIIWWKKGQNARRSRVCRTLDQKSQRHAFVK